MTLLIKQLSMSKEQSQGILNYFGHVQSCLSIEGNLKIAVYLKIEQHQKDNNKNLMFRSFINKFKYS